MVAGRDLEGDFVTSHGVRRTGRGGRIVLFPGIEHDSSMARWVVSRNDSTLTPALSALTTQDVMRMLPDGPTIVVIPTSTQRPHLLKVWLQQRPYGEAPLIMTMAQFMRRLGMQIVKDGPRILHESAVNVLLRHAASVHPSVLSLGLSAETIVRWSQHDVQPEQLELATDEADALVRSTRIRRSAAAVWRSLHHLYGSRGCDRGMYAQILVRELAAGTGSTYRHADGRNIQRLLVLDTHGVTPVDRRLLMLLADDGWDIGVRFCNDPDHSASDLPVSTTASDIQQFVVRGWHAAGQNVDPSPNTVAITTCDSRLDEVRLALLTARREVESGRTMSDICLCIPGASIYRRLLDQQASMYGVPLAMVLQRRVATTRIGAAISSALRVVTGGWQRIDLQRLLAEPLLESIGSIGAADLLEIAARDRIRGGAGPAEWHERLAWGAEATQAAKERAAADGVDDVWARDRNVRAYERAQGLVRRLEECLDADGTVMMSGMDFADFVSNAIVGRLHLEDALDAAITSGVQTVGASSASIELGACEKIRDSLMLYASLAQDHELPPLPLTEHVYAWWAMVEQMTVDAGDHHAGVAVLSPAELRCRTFAHVIVLGFIDGEFPRTKGSFFDEELLPQVARRLDVEAMADCLSAAEGGKLTLLRPRMIDDTHAIPSAFTVLVPGAQINHAAAQPAAPRHHIDNDTGVPYRSHQDVHLVLREAEDVPEEFAHERGRRMSASRLDAMYECPFAYMATKIMRLDSLRADDSRLTPLERGNVMHELIAEFFHRVKPHEPLDSVTRDELLSRRVVLSRSEVERYWTILRSLVDEYSERHAWTHTYAEAERQALVGSPNIAGLLRRWLELEIAYQQETGFAPALFELTLNEDLRVDDDQHQHVLPVSARIDRIDLREAPEGIQFVVNDYKPRAAKYTMNSVVEGGQSQMPLYIKAVATWLERHGVVAEPLAAIYRSFGASIHQTDDPQNKVVLFDQSFKGQGKSASMRYAQISKKFADLANQTLAGQVDRILPQVLPLHENIMHGRFPVLPAKGACDTCRMTEFCRVRQWGDVVVQPESHHL